MKAITFKQYGSPDVLQLEEIERPTPNDNEIVIEVHAASLNAADVHLLRADPFLVRFMFGLFKPKIPILGGDVAGIVVGIGNKVTQFTVGDAVFGDLSNAGFGGFAEYVTAPETAVITMPDNLSFEEAAAVPLAAITALQAARDKANIQPGQQVLIQGASGGVGSFAVQFAKFMGATVTAICSTKKVDFVRALGADHIIDYKKQDFTQLPQRYDTMLDAGAYRSIFTCRRVLKPGGRYVMIGGGNRQMFQSLLLGPWLNLFSNKKIISPLAIANQTDLGLIKKQVETGKLKAYVNRCFSLSETADAFRYMEAGKAMGKIVIKTQSP